MEPKDVFVSEVGQDESVVTDILSWWMKQLGGKLLTAEEEVELARQRDQGDNDARNALVSANLKLVIWVAKGFGFVGIAPAELHSAGHLGLIVAADKFDPKKGFRFSTYATWRIRQAIGRELERMGKTIRVPANVLQGLSKLEKIINKFQAENQREPSVQELIDLTGYKRRKVIMLLNYAAVQAVTMNSRDEEDGVAISDCLSDNSDELVDIAASTETRENIKDALSEILDERDQDIIIHRFELFGEPEMTLEELGDKYHITRERVRQLQAKALKKLRRDPISRAILARCADLVLTEEEKAIFDSFKSEA